MQGQVYGGGRISRPHDVTPTPSSQSHSVGTRHMLDPCRHTGRELDGCLLVLCAVSAPDNAEKRLPIFERDMALIMLGCILSPCHHRTPLNSCDAWGK